MKKTDTYTEANREAWNEVMPKHQAVTKEWLDEVFAQPGFIYQEEEEILEAFDKIGIAGKDIIHLCCNNGSELMSLKNMGANRCVGIDICDEAIEEATERAKKCTINVEFIRSNIYEIPKEFENSFDLVHTTIGGITWLPDIHDYFAVASRLLRPGGRVLLYEIHPFSDVLPWDEAENPLTIVEPYIRDTPLVHNDSLDYLGNTDYAAKTQYNFTHTISDQIMGMINNGFTVEQFTEYTKDIGLGHAAVEKANIGFPLSYILMGKKKN